MHPDDRALAAYLDMPHDSHEHRAMRSHVLACARCAAKVARLRDDERRIAAEFSGPAPDVLAATAARRRGRGRWWGALASGGWLAGTVAGALLFALLVAAQTGAVRHEPDRLFIADRAGQRVVILSADDGSTLGEVPVGDQPTRLAYDPAREQLYVLAGDGVAVLDARTPAVVGRWAHAGPSPLGAALAFDAARARLYVAAGDSISTLAAERGGLAELDRRQFDRPVAALALARDGETLFALSADGMTMWRLRLQERSVSNHALSGTPRQGASGLALNGDGSALFALLGTSLGGAPAEVVRVDAATGVPSVRRPLQRMAPPWSLAVIEGERVAVAHGDGSRGGVELFDASTLAPVGSLGHAADEHQLVAGAGDTLFVLNWLHQTVARYDTRQQALLWRVHDARWQPWAAAWVQGGWRLR